jgi:hypothetical protein
MKRGVPAVVSRISHDLFFADFEAHHRRINAEVPPEFLAEVYASAL